MKNNTPKTTGRVMFYDKGDLGARYSPDGTTIKIWAPTAEEVKVNVYAAGQGGSADVWPLKLNKDGVWALELPGDHKTNFYTVQVQHKGQWLAETADPWARAVGVNGQRAQIIDLADTNPEGWDNDQRPALRAPSDIVLYELQIRDLSSNPNSGIRHRAQFLGLTEQNTTNGHAQTTGLAHLRELGVTHVHLLPAFEFRSIDENLPAVQRPYNWGYDPYLYNVPEGSFASSPYDGAARIREFKEMVQALHKAGIRVVLDVVYNHTGGPNAESVFNRIEPDYFYRQNPDGSYSNASACGNETASERPMVRQFMTESVLYWMQEYHIDGFRFDLMGIHDIETMNHISAAAHALDPTVFFYGEGWTAGSSPLPDQERALKANTWKLDRIAAFSDDMRDGLKGSVFDHADRGFISGKAGMEESVKFGIVGATRHPQILYEKVNYSQLPWAAEPTQCINYASCHDNHTLWDKLAISCPESSEADRIRMQKLAGAILLTSQGVPFLHAGMEMCRTKQGVENSFESPDSINAIDWSRKTEYNEVFTYYKALIQLRKNHPAFRMPTADMIRANLSFLNPRGESGFIVYRIDNNANSDNWGSILVLLNGSNKSIDYTLPPGIWTVVVDQNNVKEEGLRTMAGATVRLPEISAMVLKGE